MRILSGVEDFARTSPDSNPMSQRKARTLAGAFNCGHLGPSRKGSPLMFGELHLEPASDPDHPIQAAVLLHRVMQHSSSRHDASKL